MSKRIDEFRGEYRWLSNFYPCPVRMYGVEYHCVENAFQASKEKSVSARAKYQHVNAATAKRYGRQAQLRPDWNNVRLGFMEELVRRKFKSNERLAYLLKKTGDAELIEGNNWGDTFWGVCNGKGENHLGKILMKIRSELQN